MSNNKNAKHEEARQMIQCDVNFARVADMKHLRKVLPSQSEWRARHFSVASSEMQFLSIRNATEAPPIQSLAMWRT